MNKIREIVEETEQVSENILNQSRRASLAGIGLMSRLAELDLKEIFEELVEAGEDEDIDLLINHPVILAGLGALVKARDEGGALFKDLVQAGEEYSESHDVAKLIDSSANQESVTDEPSPSVEEESSAAVSNDDGAELTALFEQAQVDVKTLTSMPDNTALTTLYANFKQATKGDVTGKRPGMTDFVARAKWDAWKKLEGKSSEEAMQGYIDFVNKLLER